MVDLDVDVEIGMNSPRSCRFSTIVQILHDLADSPQFSSAGVTCQISISTQTQYSDITVLWEIKEEKIFPMAHFVT